MRAQHRPGVGPVFPEDITTDGLDEPIRDSPKLR